MDIMKQELLKSLTFEYLRFLRETKMYTEGEKKERIASLEKLKNALGSAIDENELDNALYWTISNFATSLEGLGVNSVPHMISFTNSVLESDTDWQTRYRNFYEKKRLI